MIVIKKETEKAYQVEYSNDDGKILEWVSKSLLDEKDKNSFQLNQKGEAIFKSKVSLYEELIKSGLSS